MNNLPQEPLDNQGKFVTVFNGEINQNTEMLCNARELHKFLNVGRKFNTWIKDRIKQYGFCKDQDFIVVKNLSSPKRATAKSRQQVMIDYHITLDMAKELAMIENNEQGRKVRRYFIECEKQTLTQNYSLIDQYNKACLELDKNAPQFGGALNLVKILDKNLCLLDNNSKGARNTITNSVIATPSDFLLPILSVMGKMNLSVRTVARLFACYEHLAHPFFVKGKISQTGVLANV